MDKGAFTSHRIEERSYIAFVKKEIQDLVARASFKPMKAGEIDIIVSELTSNLVKHAGGGELLYRLYWEADNSVLELLCIDAGPGMDNIAQMMQDGVSTTNTLGHGLGTIKRLSDVCQVYSLPDWGTLIYTQIRAAGTEKQRPDEKGASIVALTLPQTGELLCGDGYSIKRSPESTQIFLGDGLGHGLYAHEAVETAIQAFRQSTEQEPVAILRSIHQAVKKTRGLVATVAVLHHASKTWHSCGVGNIHARLYEGLSFRTFLSYNGIVGLNMLNSMNAHVLPAENNQRLIMCSDGLRTRWDLNKYPNIFKCHPMILAGILYKDFCRGHDDASVLVGKVTL